jgi:hypothetical protein
MHCTGTIMREVNYFTTEIRPKYKTETDIISLIFWGGTCGEAEINDARNAIIQCILYKEYI